MKPATHLSAYLLLLASTIVSASPLATDSSIAPKPTLLGSLNKQFYTIHCSTYTGGTTASASDARAAAQALCFDSVQGRPDPKRENCRILNSVGNSAIAVCAKGDPPKVNCEDIIQIALEMIGKCEDPGPPWKVRGHAEFTWGTFNVYAV